MVFIMAKKWIDEKSGCNMIDADSWFATNNRFFFYEYPAEFDTEQEAIDYFKSNINEFFELNVRIMGNQRPSFNNGGVYLENESRFIVCK